MKQEKRNSKVFLRPRFSLEVAKPKVDIISLLESELNYSIALYKYKISDNQIFIDICKNDSHFWSPHLHLEVIEVDKSISKIKGLFSPKHQVWALFMFLYFIIWLTFLAALTMFYVNNTLDKNIILSLMMSIFLPVIWLTLYFMGRIGRDFGKKQIKGIHDLLFNTIMKD